MNANDSKGIYPLYRCQIIIPSTLTYEYEEFNTRCVVHIYMKWMYANYK